MTHRSDVERLLDHWLVDGPTEAHDRVIETVAERIGRQRQQPAWRVSWRDSHVNTSLKRYAPMAAVIVLALVGIAMVARPSGSTIGAPAASASASAAASASPIAWDNIAGPCGEVGCFGPQQAGTYTSRGLVPSVTYTLTSPWVNQRDWNVFFLLYPDISDNRRTAARGEYPPHLLILPAPVVSQSDTCVESSPKDVVAVDAAQFVAFVEGRPHLLASGSVPVTINGLAGRQVDVAIGDGWSGCIPGAPIGEFLTRADKVRFIILDRPGSTSLMIRLRAPTDFNALMAVAMPVVESLTFGPEPSPSPS